MTLEDILNNNSQTFSSKDIQDFLENNKAHIISGRRLFESHNFDFLDMIDITIYVIRENLSICDIDALHIDYADELIEDEEFDMLADEVFSGKEWDLWYTKTEQTIDIPFYKDKDKIIVLPFISYEVEAGNTVYTDFKKLYDTVVEVSKIEDKEFNFEYTYNYEHDQEEEWWDEGEGTFSVKVESPNVKQIKDCFDLYQTEVDKFLAKPKNKNIERE